MRYADAPKLTKSMRMAKRDLGLKHLWVICPGKEMYPMAEGIDCVGLERMEGIFQRHFS